MTQILKGVAKRLLKQMPPSYFPSQYPGSCRLGLSSEGPLMMGPDLSRVLGTAWNCIHFYNTLESILFQLPHHETQDEGEMPDSRPHA